MRRDSLFLKNLLKVRLNMINLIHVLDKAGVLVMVFPKSLATFRL